MLVARHWLSACMLLGTLLATFHEPAHAAKASYTVAIVPVLPATDIKRRWQPLLDALARETGLSFRFRLYEDNAQIEASLLRSEPDFAMLGAFQLWQARPHYLPILRDTRPMIGMVVVRQDSALHTLNDLHERTLAIPNGSDMTASLLQGQILKELKVHPQVKTQRTHVNGLRAVMLGKIDAAVINNYSLQLLPPELTKQLRVIYRTEPLPPPAFAVAPRVPATDVRKVKAAFLRLNTTQPAMLEAALMPNITEADMERDYGILSRILPAEATAHAQP